MASHSKKNDIDLGRVYGTINPNNSSHVRCNFCLKVYKGGVSRMKEHLVVKYNRALKRRYDSKDITTPVILEDIDESNEWLLGIMEGNSDDEEDLVFSDGDDLTWDVVGRASGANDPIYATRASRIANLTGSSSRVNKGKGKASSGVTGVVVLDDDEDDVIEEDSGEDDDYVGEEGDDYEEDDLEE